MKIGFDLDNTIIDYNFSFCSIGMEKGWLPKGSTLSKPEVKEKLIKEDGNDERWQVLQSLAYGPKIGIAKIYDGYQIFLDYCLANNFEVVIISHKTKFSNYNPEIELRSSALEWLKDRAILSSNMLSVDQINFCSTLEEKALKIKDENCDFFVDDLEKVICAPNFPLSTLPILFSKTCSQESIPLHFDTWSKIHNYFKNQNDLSLSDRVLVYRVRKELPESTIFIKRDGNNQLIKCIDTKGQYVIKRYSPTSNELSPRGNTEFSALQYMYNNGIKNIPMPVMFDGRSAIYSFVHGEQISEMGKDEGLILGRFVAFLSSLKLLSDKSGFEDLNRATDSRSCLADYFSKVEERLLCIRNGLKSLEKISEISHFVDQELVPFKEILFKDSLEKIKRCDLDLEKNFPKEQQMLSPSDMGLHNCLFNKEDVNFIDFEYFGWDDSVKLIADISFHAGFESSNDFKTNLRDQFFKIFKSEAKLKERFDIVSRLIELEWILIVLNVLDPKKLERRKFANPELDLTNLLDSRFKKAQTLFSKARRTRSS
jgi:hypothetical protein